MEFDPERCADMHNILLRRSLEHDPDAVIERNLVARFLIVAPDFAQIPNLEDQPIYRFFSLLDTTTPFSPERGGPGMLTPTMLQPDPTFFWSDTFSIYDQPSVVLLYGENGSSAPMDGGLFLNLQTCKVIWHWAPGPFPPAERWMPLQFALQKALDHWDSGKYEWNAEYGQLAVKPWTQEELNGTLSSWDRLLSSIEARMPESGSTQRLNALQLSEEVMANFRLGEFASEFLTRSDRPAFRFVAPGIATFTADTFHEAYSSEATTTSSRRSVPAGQGDPDGREWSSLVLPIGSAVIPNTSESRILDIQSFDRPWGFGKFTLSRQAGLYIIPDIPQADTARLILPSGLSTACEFKGRCPWGPSRSPRLAEVLDHWASLVEDGTWEVGEDGVAGGCDWFYTHLDRAQLDWWD